MSGKFKLTNALRRIRNAWHFYHALILVIMVVCRIIVLRCSPLKRALFCLFKLWRTAVSVICQSFKYWR
ncbi:DUF3265 domain-containing protein, partial [Vibrio cholerae]|nr:DUF3265 domain-containing protein [Vibrio cholerae]